MKLAVWCPNHKMKLSPVPPKACPAPNAAVIQGTGRPGLKRSSEQQLGEWQLERGVVQGTRCLGEGLSPVHLPGPTLATVTANALHAASQAGPHLSLQH